MRLGKDLVGKQIISITDGRLLGTVKDLYVEENLRWLTGIHLGSEGLIKRKSLLVTRQDVVVFGIDAILVKHADVVTDDQQFTEVEHWLRLSKLRGRDMDTPGGTKVGTVGDVTLGEEGDITGFTLGRVYVEGPVAEQGFIPRHALLDTGSVDGTMSIDLAKAENVAPPPSAADDAPSEEKDA